MDENEQELLALLEDLSVTDSAQSAIERAVAEAKEELKDKEEKLGSSVQLPLSVFGDRLPPIIKSCRVFVLRGGTEFKIERHPNSHQRVLSFGGSGEIRVFDNEGTWTASLGSVRQAPLDERWASVPENMWHQPVAGPDDWAVLAFHTASEEDLIDEYGV